MIKRIFDLLSASLIIVFFIPIFLIIYILIFLTLGSPVIFKQKRPGLKTKPFYIYKFRTMLEIRDAKNKVLPDNLRLTKVGLFFRSLSLDELPSLWNVIKGDMSLVGPRPLLMEYLPLYNKKQYRRHDVKPGITGWAQVNGRNSLSWQDRFNLDVWYVDNQSFLLDLKILVMTFKKVIFRNGISEDGHVTMSKFTGNTK
jgi:lipopolysaccharide/colanic/teichoic acid biosynthesis glycosyltransferase